MPAAGQRDGRLSPYIQAPPLSVTAITKAPPPLSGDLPVALLLTPAPPPKRLADVVRSSPPSVSEAPPHPVYENPYTLRVRLTVAAVSELSILCNLQLAGVGGGDPVAGLHAVTFLQLAESAHQTSVGSIQRRYPLLLQRQEQKQLQMNHRGEVRTLHSDPEGSAGASARLVPV